MKRIIAIFTLLQILDVITTLYGLNIGGSEAAPLVIAILGTWGTIGWISVKVMLVGVAILLYVWLKDEPPLLKFLTYGYSFVVCVFAVIVVWNTYNIIVLWRMAV